MSTPTCAHAYAIGGGISHSNASNGHTTISVAGWGSGATAEASGVKCVGPLSFAVNLNTGGIAWNVPLGTMGGVLGSPNLGGPIITAGGVVFIGATLDRAIRAFDVETGRELWKADLPAGARATPMTYEAGGRQFVVIAAGGGGPFGTGDAIIAFALPK